MTANYLKFNNDKSECMPVVPRSAAHLLEELTISIGEVRVSAVNNVRNLGAYLDSHLDMSHKVAILLKSCYFHMYHIGQIRKFRPRKTIERAVNAMITSRIDYCNALLYGTSGKSLAKLRLLQNIAAKRTVGGLKYEHVTPILRESHWLPVESRIHFKIMVSVHRAVNDTGPVYLQELVNMYRPGRSLRSQCDKLLTRPRTRSRAGDATFVSAAADLWNTLTLNLRLIEDICSFRTALKARTIFHQALW